MADTRERMAKETGAPDLVLGTAGHIDHGKSSLVRALTGVDPDRLEEEKRRGITITLGFAQLALPDGRTVGVVDVPGHEKFVKHMIAGATGIDVALLVIAADDGVMPQTVEHVAVLQTLGITRCVVALTKIDLVDDEWRAFMKGEVEAWLANTAYAHAPVIEVSSKTGEGLDELKRALQAECDKAEHVKHGSLLRLPVDRVFTIKGAGTVVTGTLWSGTARPGDEIEILPEGARTRIRSVQMHNQPVEAAPAGNRVALNLNNVKTDEVHVGDMLCAPASIEPTDQIDVRLTYIDVAGTGKPLATGARMHVAYGTREVLGRVLLCDKVPQLAPGGSVYAQIRLEEPIAASYGDRFIVRTYSPVSVAGGGVILLAHPRRRTTLSAPEHELLDALREGDLPRACELSVQQAARPVSAADVARMIGWEEPAVARDLDAAVDFRAIEAFAAKGMPRLYWTKRQLQRSVSAIEKALVAFHTAHPGERGMGKAELQAQVAAHMPAPVFDGLVDRAVAADKAVVVGNTVGHPSFGGNTDEAERAAGEAILAALAEGGMTPEALPYLLSKAVDSPSLASRALARLEKEGAVVRLNREYAFDGAVFHAHVQALREWLTAHGSGTVADLKEPLGTSRKFAVPILEYLDAHGVTRRDGDSRTLQ